MIAAHREPIADVVRRVDVDPSSGLSELEARNRLEKGGPNQLPPALRPSAFRRFLSQFANPIVITLLVAGVIAVIDGGQSHAAADPFLMRYGDAIAILLIVALNAGLGFYQERRAEAALDALEKMQTPNARALRNGKSAIVPARDLVLGDIIDLEAGDAVPADARLLQAINMSAEESALTGESTTVSKDALAILPEDAALGDRSTMVFVGTTVIRGKGRAVITATGPQTEIGKLNELIREASQDRRTPLEDKLDAFGKKILWTCLGLSALLFLRGAIKGDRSWSALFLEAVSIAVAAIPEGLPAITTITLALGMQRMARRGAIVRKLSAVETLGAATVICSDKTGTLTQNEMTVKEVYTGERLYRTTGVGYDPRGTIVDDAGACVDDPSKPLRHLLEIVALCNNASLDQKDGAWVAVGDPTEAALLTLSEKGGMERSSVASSHQVVREVPFDSDRKRMSILTLDAKGREVAHVKGSADILLPLCTKLDTEGGVRDLSTKDRERITEELERMSREAYRVLAVARRIVRIPEERSAPSESSGSTLDIEQQLTFVGLVAMVDPPREGVKEAIRTCGAGGVRAVMITGDHRLTAQAVARELELWSEGDITLTGIELGTMSDQALAEKVDHVRVFARVTAEQKLRIVRAFKARGHVVAMTGDGVNDAPALQEAHIGVAMGRSGTDVARQASDMVIVDDNFKTIVEAIVEGRAIYRNIQKFIFFLLSSNAGLLVAVFVSSFLRDVQPLTPLMILWINLVTNGLPALGLGVDPPDPSQMTEAPRKATSGLLEGREIRGIAIVGLAMGSGAIACYLWPWDHAQPTASEQARAIAFSLLALSPLFHALSCRSATESILRLRPLVTLPLVLAICISAIIHLVAVLIPSLHVVFRTFAMSTREWSILLLFSMAIVPVMEVVKF